MKTKILFVCMGNICRSPAAEEIFRQKVREKGLEDLFHIDSAGTHGYHEGELPDSRMREHAAKRNYRLTSRSRPVQTEDFFEFDHIIVMDNFNYQNLRLKSPDVESFRKVSMMTDYCRNNSIDHVPDPYYGGIKGFELVLDILEDACENLAEQLSKNSRQ